MLMEEAVLWRDGGNLLAVPTAGRPEFLVVQNPHDVPAGTSKAIIRHDGSGDTCRVMVNPLWEPK